MIMGVFSGKTFFIKLLIRIFLRKLHHHNLDPVQFVRTVLAEVSRHNPVGLGPEQALRLRRTGRVVQGNFDLDVRVQAHIVAKESGSNPVGDQ